MSRLAKKVKVKDEFKTLIDKAFCDEEFMKLFHRVRNSFFTPEVSLEDFKSDKKNLIVKSKNHDFRGFFTLLLTNETVLEFIKSEEFEVLDFFKYDLVKDNNDSYATKMTALVLSSSEAEVYSDDETNTNVSTLYSGEEIVELFKNYLCRNHGNLLVDVRDYLSKEDADRIAKHSNLDYFEINPKINNYIFCRANISLLKEFLAVKLKEDDESLQNLENDLLIFVGNFKADNEKIMFVQKLVDLLGVKETLSIFNIFVKNNSIISLKESKNILKVYEEFGRDYPTEWLVNLASMNHA